MKNLSIICVIIVAVGCDTSKPTVSGTSLATPTERTSSVEFLENISLQPKSQSNFSGTPRGTLVSEKKYANKVRFSASSIESYSALQFKYAILTNAAVEQMNNLRLLNFIEEWYGTRYHYGGNSHDGIDCSAFVCSLLSSVYDVNNLPRMSKDQYLVTKHVDRDELKEGDLVFFHTQGKHKTVTHVGIYLLNNKFIHASIAGVMISDMGEGYYHTHYVGAGRVRD